MLPARIWIIGLVFVLVLAQSSAAQTPVGTAFTYQGRLADGASFASGTYDLGFALYDGPAGGDQIGPAVEKEDVSVADGFFTVSLDFGGGVFEGYALWLQIGVRPGSSTGEYTLLTSRQEMTPTPNAVFSQAAPWSGLSDIPAGFADGVDNDSGGDITAVSAGTGLTGGGTAGDVTLGVSFGTSGTTVASGNHNHFGQTWNGSGPGLQVSSTDVALHGVTSSASSYAISGRATATTGATTGVFGRSDSADGYGVYGHASDTTGANTGVLGRSDSINGVGVEGSSSASTGYTKGVSGWNSSSSGTGVYGRATATTGYNSGVNGTSESSTGTGVGGWATATTGANYGVYGRSNSSGGVGVAGFAAATIGGTVGVRGETSSSSSSSSAVYGLASRTTGGAVGVLGETSSSSSTTRAVYGRATATAGAAVAVLGESNLDGGRGVIGQGNWGVYGIGVNFGVIGVTYGTTSSDIGVYGAQWFASSDAWAGYFSGDVQVTGALTKGGGSFKIDHPLDPANKYLYHSFVESPDMMNVYNGNVTTDERGYATIELPEWFEALNRDFRYQLTVLDEGDGDVFTQAKVVSKVNGNRFTIRTSLPGTEVSWQLTGIRKDAWAEKHRIPVEELKSDEERGTYLHPEAVGVPIESGLDYKRMPDQDRERLRNLASVFR